MFADIPGQKLILKMGGSNGNCRLNSILDEKLSRSELRKELGKFIEKIKRICQRVFDDHHAFAYTEKSHRKVV